MVYCLNYLSENQCIIMMMDTNKKSAIAPKTTKKPMEFE